MREGSIRRTRRAIPPADEGQSHTSTSGLWLRVGLIVLAGALIYSNSLSGPFILDDQLSIVANQQIRHLSSLGDVLVPERELPVAGRPLVNLSFAINYAMGGLEPRGYHLWNIAVHILCALVLFGIARRTLNLPSLERRFAGNSANLAFAAALLWVLHPLQTEAVNYLTQRTESMMALFYLLTLYAAIRAGDSGRARKRRWQIASSLSCILGMACKESMVTAPLMVVLYDRVFLYDRGSDRDSDRGSWRDSLRDAFRSRWRLYAGLAASWIVLAALMWSGPRVHSAGFGTPIGPWTYLLNQPAMIVQYLRLAVWPRARSLVVDYGVPLPQALSNVAPQALFVALLLLLTVVALIRRPTLGFLGAWFFVTLAPTSSVVPIATEVGSERRMYLPLAALVVLAVIGAALLWDRLKSSGGSLGVVSRRVPDFAGIVPLVLVAGWLATQTVIRNGEYSSGVSLARTVLERRPHGRAHNTMGTELIAAGLRDEGLAELREATTGDPRAHYTLGMELFADNKLDEAIGHLQEFIRLEPALLEVISARETLGRAFEVQGQQDAAADQYRQLLKMIPSYADAHARLADVLLKQEKFEEASLHCRELLKSRPNNAGALTNFGIALSASGQKEEAAAAFRRAAEADPQSSSAHRNLANALLDTRDFAGAASAAQRAVSLTPADPVAHYLLGVALASQGMLDEAIEQFRQALQIDPAYVEARDGLAMALRAKVAAAGGR